MNSIRINNRRKVIIIRRVFFLTSVLIAATALLFFLTDMVGAALISVGVFSVWYLFFHVADYQFIEFSNENGRIILRYYKAISFGRPKYNEIEFPQALLKEAFFDNSVYGKMSDVTLVVKTKQGIAEYPSVSLSAVSLKDRQKIAQALKGQLMRTN